MTKENKTTDYYQKMTDFYACGRSFEEQVETIEKYCGHGVSKTLKLALLSSLGIPASKDKAQNCVVFGCYRPFMAPFFIRDSIRLLEILHIDYTYLDNEYCCGAPLLMVRSKEQQEYAKNAGKKFNLKNLNLAQEKGATKLAYCCNGCAYSARNTFTEHKSQHVYILDLILDELENRKLRLPPTVMGYFEGCHASIRRSYPSGDINWDRYRQLLSSIEGLQIRDVPNNMCCKNSSHKIIQTAKEMNISQLIVPCSGCFAPLTEAAKDNLQIIGLPELLLRSIKYST